MSIRILWSKHAIDIIGSFARYASPQALVESFHKTMLSAHYLIIPPALQIERT